MKRKDSWTIRKWPLHRHPVCPPLYADAYYLPYILGIWCVTDTVISAVDVQQQQKKQDNRQSGDGVDDGIIHSLFTPLIQGGIWLIKSGTRGDMNNFMKSFGKDSDRLILLPQIHDDSDKRLFSIDDFNAMYLVPDSPTYTKTSLQLSVALDYVHKKLVNM